MVSCHYHPHHHHYYFVAVITIILRHSRGEYVIPQYIDAGGVGGMGGMGGMGVCVTYAREANISGLEVTWVPETQRSNACSQ